MGAAAAVLAGAAPNGLNASLDGAAAILHEFLCVSSSGEEIPAGAANGLRAEAPLPLPPQSDEAGAGALNGLKVSATFVMTTVSPLASKP